MASYRTYLRWDLPHSSTEGSWSFTGTEQGTSHENAARNRVHDLARPHDHESILVVNDECARLFRIERQQAFALREER